MFITFEGLDFSGKSTQARLLHQWFKSHKKRSVLLREPGGSRISEKVREILLDKDHLEMTEITEFLLFSASRAQLVNEIIRPHLKKSTIVICDRYFDSSTAYQGYGGKVDIEKLLFVNDFAAGGLVPDITFLLDITPKAAFSRHASRGNAKDRMENKSPAFYNRVRQGFLEIAKQNRKRFVVLNSTDSVDEIHSQILSQVNKKLKS